MKKYLALALSMMFVLGIAGSAFAIHASIPAETTGVVGAKDVQIQIEGELRTRGWYEENISSGGVINNKAVKATTGRPYDTGSMSWYDQRVRLAIDAKIADNVSGRVHLENGGNQSDHYIWGTTNTANNAGTNPRLGGEKRGTLEILEAWIAYTGSGLLGVPAGIKIGHMPVVVGEGVFFDHRRFGDDALLLFVEPAKGTEINLITAKLFEGTSTGTAPNIIGGATDNTDDLDLYSLMLTHKLDKDNTLGANLSLIKSSDIDGTAGALGSAAGLLGVPTAGLNFADSTLDLYNIGLNAKGKVAGVGYKATADMQFGKIKDIVVAGTEDDAKFRGYGVTLGANYKVDPVTLRANFVYGSGDNDLDDEKVKTFQTFVGTVIDPNLPTVVYGWRVHTAAGALGTGISNTTAYNLGVTYSPVKDLTLALDGYLLRASKKLADTGFGSDKKIGTEVDLKVTYRLAKNLTYSINSGILFAGDFYETGVAGPTNDAKDAVVLQHQIVLSF